MGTPDTDITAQLELAATDDDFGHQCAELAESWTAANFGIESVEPILRFMEQQPNLDYGSPGPLVHYVEQFYRQGYDDLLRESVERRPTAHTIWMLNRLINCCRSEEARQPLVELMKRSRVHALIDKRTAGLIDRLLSRTSS